MLAVRGRIERSAVRLRGDKSPGAASPGTSEGALSVRFIGILAVLALIGLTALFIYGQMMEPDVREYEVEAVHDAQ